MRETSVRMVTKAQEEKVGKEGNQSVNTALDLSSDSGPSKRPDQAVIPCVSSYMGAVWTGCSPMNETCC